MITGASMLLAHLAAQSVIPGWLEVPSWLHWPDWLRPLGHLVHDHQSIGLFLVVFLEELGVPLPAPGDVAIAYGGYLTTTGEIPYLLAYVAVITGAVTGSFCLFSISRRYGQPFLIRFGPRIGFDAERIAWAERTFARWGFWGIIVGRHIPGMRIVLSAFAGVFNVPTRVFVPSVFISASIWAAIFLELGRLMGRNSRYLFRLVPVHLLPLAVVVGVIIVVAYLAVAHGWRPWRVRRRPGPQKRAGADRPEEPARSRP